MEKTIVTEDMVKNALGKVLNKTVANYAEGKDDIATSTIVVGEDWERWLFAIWPGNMLELHYACSGLPIIDVGDQVCAFDMGYFNVDQIVKMTIQIITNAIT